ncbi:chemotaxis protein CheW [Methylobacterium sp. E-065]|uniref:chemotaxis protein CheW n=1 Tax=Methylobacterium sp. E-065 TaxID=2836583 RepID=UPI001FB91352|nr:chemotaxis protein CheW [Methylobacterium sp. E-065]MCJ2016437.1 chemotaxis protein CheW [Methylobacterium sp. E-065]
MPETGDDRYLVFTLGPDDFALDAGSVRELLRPPRLTRIPGAPATLAGLANLRGTALPVIDLRRVMRPDVEPASEATRVVVAEASEPVGLMVDHVLAFVGGTKAAEEDATSNTRTLHTSVGSGRARIIDLPTLVGQAFPRRTKTPTATLAAGNGEPVAVDAERIALVSFAAAGRSYALPLERVSEVMALPSDVVPVPRSDKAALGVVALRSSVLPLLGLPALFGHAAPPPSADARIVVARIGETEVGLVVDALGPILRVAPDAVDPVPAALRRGGMTAVDAICRLDGDGALVSILSVDRLLEGTTVTASTPRASDTRDPDDRTTGATEQFVVFDVGGESYGVPVAAVREVLRVPTTMTRLPRSPDLVAGAIDVRGTVLAVVDQRRRFGLPPGEADPRRRILLLEDGGTVAGILVDGVSRMLRLPSDAVRPVPCMSGEPGAAVDRVATLEDGTLLPLVDAHALLVGTERSLRAAVKGIAGSQPGLDATA